MKRGFAAVQDILNLKVESVWGFKILAPTLLVYRAH
jgi:hypothetical protein